MDGPNLIDDVGAGRPHESVVVMNFPLMFTVGLAGCYGNHSGARTVSLCER